MDGKNFHLIGICGTAMGALAAALKARGHHVTGSDENVYEPMASFLRNVGVQAREGFRSENIPDDADVIIVGNAISRGNPELESTLNRGLYYVSMSEALKENFLRGRRNYVVTGTHGKTTTTSMLAWLLESAGRSPGWFIGGIPENLGRGSDLRDSREMVIEGDEYDTAFFDKRPKFMHYLPNILIINNLEFDHADIYKDLDDIKLAFRRVLVVVPGNGCVIANGDDANCRDVASTCPAPVKYLGMGADNDLKLAILARHTDATEFELDGETYRVPMTGEYNVRNAAMATAAARMAGLSVDEIRGGLLSYRGVARRQQVRGERRGVTVVDDFGHHPTAIRETLGGLRQRFPGARVWALFEPRSNTSRRNVYQKEFAQSLALADGAVIATVERAEKVPEGERLDPLKVASDIEAHGGQGWCESSVDAIIARIRPLVASGDVVVVFSNGGFGGIHHRLLEEL